MRRSDKILSGAKAQADGLGFENSLDLAHKAFRARGIAWIEHLPVPTVPAGPVLRRLSRKQRYDYDGVLGPNAGPSYDLGRWFGLAIAMEAKATAEQKPSLPIVKEDGSSGGLKIHQLDALAEAWRDFGVIAVLVWRNGDQRLVLLPPAVDRAHRTFHAGGRRSIPVAAFEPFDVVPYPQHSIVEDWLYPVRGWLQSNGRPCPAQSRLKDYDMVNYRYDEGSKTVTIPVVGDGEDIVLENVTADQHMLNHLAIRATSPEDLRSRIESIGPANE